MVQVRKMGSLTDIIKMIPGMGQAKQLKNLQVDENEFIRIEAIINSMTPQERQDVNRLLKNYTQVMKMIKKLNKGGMRGINRGMLPF
jgi:signal recognition particle subunit SRP54